MNGGGGSSSNHSNHHKSSKVKELLSDPKSVGMEIEINSVYDNCNLITSDQPLNLSCNDNRKSVSPSTVNHSSYLNSNLKQSHHHHHPLDLNGKSKTTGTISSSSLLSSNQSTSTGTTLLRPSSYGSHDDDSSTCYSFHSDSGIDKPLSHSPISLTSHRKQPSKSKFDINTNKLNFRLA